MSFKDLVIQTIEHFIDNPLSQMYSTAAGFYDCGYITENGNCGVGLLFKESAFPTIKKNFLNFGMSFMTLLEYWEDLGSREDLIKEKYQHFSDEQIQFIQFFHDFIFSKENENLIQDKDMTDAVLTTKARMYQLYRLERQYLNNKLYPQFRFEDPQTNLSHLTKESFKDDFDFIKFDFFRQCIPLMEDIYDDFEESHV